jgi:hypothetical protein
VKLKYRLAARSIDDLNVLPPDISDPSPQRFRNGFFSREPRCERWCVPSSVDQFLSGIKTIEKAFTVSKNRTINSIDLD